MIELTDISKIVLGIILAASFVIVMAAILKDLLTEYYPLRTVDIPPPPKQMNKEKRIMNLNELKDDAYRIACEHGWHDEEHSDVHCLMLIVTELSEAVEADRKNRHAAIEAFKADMDFALHEMNLFGKRLDDYMKGKFELYIKDSVEDELADVVIRCLDLAGLRKIQLPDQMTIEGWKVKISCPESFSEWAYKTTRMVTRESYPIADKVYIHRILFFVYARAEYMGIDLMWHIEQKMKYNESRPYKHGKKY